MTLQNEKFEELLAQQLTRELEPQRGRAAAAFAAQVAAEAAQRAEEERAARVAGGSRNKESWARREVSGRSLLVWTGAPALIAAALAVVVTLHFVGAGSRPAGQNTIDTRIVNNVLPAPPMRGGADEMANGNSGSATIVRDAVIYGGGGGTVVSDVTLMQSYPGVVVIKESLPVRAVVPQAIGGMQWGDPADHEAYKLPEPPQEEGVPSPMQPK